LSPDSANFKDIVMGIRKHDNSGGCHIVGVGAGYVDTRNCIKATCSVIVSYYLFREFTLYLSGLCDTNVPIMQLSYYHLYDYNNSTSGSQTYSVSTYGIFVSDILTGKAAYGIIAKDITELERIYTKSQVLW
jgi:hypothetical protein